MNKQPEAKLVPVPSTNIIPERDADKSPILEARHRLFGDPFVL